MFDELRKLNFKVRQLFDTTKNKYHNKYIAAHWTHVKGDDLNSLWLAEDKNKISWNFHKKVVFLRSLDYQGTRPERIKIILDYENKLKKCYNDHHNVLINEHTEPHNYFAPIQVENHDNLVVQSGLTKITELVAGASNTYFTFLEVGENNGGIGLLNTRLQAPVYRVNVTDIGWFEAHGNALFTGSVFPDDMRSMDVKEMGGFDLPTDPSTMFWRIVITEAAKILKHRLGETFLSLSHTHTFD